jgi:hypothetical protein
MKKMSSRNTMSIMGANCIWAGSGCLLENFIGEVS